MLKKEIHLKTSCQSRLFELNIDYLLLVLGYYLFFLLQHVIINTLQKHSKN